MDDSLKQTTQKEHRTRLWVLVLILIVVTAIWGLSGWFLYPLGDVKRGTFGDMFGAVNSLFSGLAFAALIFTIFMQREELLLQRQELEYTRIELTRSATAQEQSEAALRAQAETASQAAALSAINALLGYYREEIEMSRKNPTRFGTSPKESMAHFGGLIEREAELLRMLDSTFQQITGEYARKQQSVSESP